jgi:molybdopterin converting factor small subunit
MFSLYTRIGETLIKTKKNPCSSHPCLQDMRSDSDEFYAAVNVHARLYGILREKLPPGGQATLSLAAGSTIGDVVDRLAITGHVQTAVNGHIKSLDTVLADGDTIEIFRAAAGG